MCVAIRASSSLMSLRSTSTATSSSTRCWLNSGPVAAVKPLRQPLLVSLLDLRPQLCHARRRRGQPVERAAQNRLQRLAFARAHCLQLFQQRHDLFQHACASAPRSSSVRDPRSATRRADAMPRSGPARPSAGVRGAPRQMPPDNRRRVRDCIPPLPARLDRPRESDRRGREPDSLSAPCAAPSPARRGPTGSRNCRSRKR